MSVRGNFKEISFVNLVQLNCQANVTACLQVSSEIGQGEVYFAGGNVVHVWLNDQSGEEAFRTLLTCKHGEFALEQNKIAPQRTIFSRYTDLLLGGLQQLDESAPPQAPADSPQDLTGAMGAWFSIEAASSSNPSDSVLQKEQAMTRLEEVLVEMGEEIPGFIAVVVSGSDGIVLGAYEARTGIQDTELAGAQMALVMSLVNRVAKKLNMGALDYNLVTTNDQYMLQRALEDNQFWVNVTVSRQTSLGALRLVLSKFAPQIYRALPGIA